ncbi:MAG: VOC family protein [Deferribacterales bacterium]
MKYGSTAIFTKDIQASRHFYSELLGLSIMMDNGTHVAFNGGLNIWDISQANNVIFGGAQPEPAGYKMELCFDSEDVSADYEKALENGLNILNPLAEQPWGQLLFRVYDPDGTIVEIAESIFDTFRRLQTEGLSLEQISAKTFTSVEDLKRFLSVEDA